MLISKSLIKQFGLDLFTYLFSSTKDLSHYFYRLSILLSYTNSYTIFIFYCLFELRVSLKNDLCYHSSLFLNLIFTNNLRYHSTVYLTAFSHKFHVCNEVDHYSLFKWFFMEKVLLIYHIVTTLKT